MVAFKIYLEDKPREFADQLDVGVRGDCQDSCSGSVSRMGHCGQVRVGWWGGLLFGVGLGHVHLRGMLEKQWSVRGTDVFVQCVSGLET